MNNLKEYRFYAFLALLAGLLLSLHLLHITPVIAYAAVFMTSSVVYLLVCRDALALKQSLRRLITVLILLFLVRLSFIDTHPVGSDDFYRYVWDGKVQLAGINPYRHAPTDTTLASLHTELIPRLVNHPDMKTLYFPLSEWMFAAAYMLSTEHIWGIHLLILLAEIATVIGLILVLREIGYSPWYVLLYAANPLIILQFSLDAHVDALGFPFLAFGVLFYLRGRLNLSLLLVGLSLLIKPAALIVLPILFFDQQGMMNRVKTIAVPLVVMLLPFLPYSFGVNPFSALTTFTEHWYFNGALFNLLLPLFPDNQTNRLWCLAILVVLIVLLCFSQKSFGQKLVLSVLLLLLCSPVAHPWYVGWMIVLLPLAPVLSGITLAATASLPSLTFVSYQLHGVWKDYPGVLLLEYIPVVLLLVYDLKKTAVRGMNGWNEVRSS